MIERLELMEETSGIGEDATEERVIRCIDLRNCAALKRYRAGCGTQLPQTRYLARFS